VGNGYEVSGAGGEFEDNVKDYMAKIFHSKNIGNIDRIDLIPKETPQGHTYFIAFVHFTNWYVSVEAKQLQKDINDSSVKAKVQFNESWYWICSKNNKPARTPPEKGPSYDELKTLLAAQNETIASLQAIIDQFKMAAPNGVVTETTDVPDHLFSPPTNDEEEEEDLAEDGYPKPPKERRRRDDYIYEHGSPPSPSPLRRTDNSEDVDLGQSQATTTKRRLNWSDEE
tara:strand:+ start:1032 stop:1712 length:681 start_codon:yes stop_codon:yes gene_type:complete